METASDVHTEVTAVKAHPLRDAMLVELRHIVRCLSVADIIHVVAQEATHRATRHTGVTGEVWRWTADELGEIAAEYRGKSL